MDASFKLLGLAELNKQLKALPEEFRTKNLNAAVGASTRLIRDQAKINVKKDTGNLEGAIRSQKKKTASKYIGKHQVNINPKGKVTILTRGKKRRSTATYYGKFLEDGTAKQAAQPFMRPAFDLKKVEAVEKFGKVLDRKIRLSQKKIARIRK